MNRHINSFLCFDQQLELTKRKIPLLGSGLDEPRLKGLESLENDYRGSTTDTPTKKIDYFSDIMHHKVSLCKHNTHYSYKQVRVKMMIKISSLIRMELKNFLCAGRRVRSANGIHEVIGIQPVDNFLTNFSTVAKKFPK